MALLNYTTKVASEKTVGEMQEMLCKAGVAGCSVRFSEGEISGLSIEIETIGGLRSFLLPANIDGVFETLKAQKAKGNVQISKVGLTRAQAARVAWRILKDWLEAQLALIETRQATIEQIMLPYLLVAPDRTLYDEFKQSRFALPPPSSKHV